MHTFLEKWLTLLTEKKELAVATVVSGVGSRPRENGAQMLVTESGFIWDTIGGGKLEAGVIAGARQVIRQKMSRLDHFALTGRDAALSDMICGGEGDVFIYYSNVQDINTLKQITVRQELNGWLLFPLDLNDGIVFIPEEKNPAESGPSGESFPRAVLPQDIAIIVREERRYLVKRLTEPGKLHIMGAGHIAREIVKIAGIVGMACYVYDDRPEFVNKDRFPQAHGILLEDLSAPPALPLRACDMIVIVTRGHLYDQDCLQWALTTKAG